MYGGGMEQADRGGSPWDYGDMGANEKTDLLGYH